MILGQIGRGAYGAVYRARHLKFDLDVAVKVLDSRLAARDEDFVRRFWREGRSAARLSHQNVLKVFQVEEDNGLHYIVMELVDGESVRDRMERVGRLSVAECLTIARAVAHGLGDIHGHGLIHRDVKPDNLLVSTRGAVKVADLGLAKPRLDHDTPGDLTLTCQGAILGTPRYMAPEQWVSDATLTPATDVWAVGATLYHMLTGEHGVPQEALPGLMHGVASSTALDPSTVCSEVPADLAAIVLRATDADPRKRFQDARELAEALDGLGEPSVSLAFERPAAPEDPVAADPDRLADTLDVIASTLDFTPSSHPLARTDGQDPASARTDRASTRRNLERIVVASIAVGVLSLVAWGNRGAVNGRPAETDSEAARHPSRIAAEALSEAGPSVPEDFATPAEPSVISTDDDPSETGVDVPSGSEDSVTPADPSLSSIGDAPSETGVDVAPGPGAVADSSAERREAPAASGTETDGAILGVFPLPLRFRSAPAIDSGALFTLRSSARWIVSSVTAFSPESWALATPLAPREFTRRKDDGTYVVQYDDGESLALHCTTSAQPHFVVVRSPRARCTASIGADGRILATLASPQSDCAVVRLDVFRFGRTPWRLQAEATVHAVPTPPPPKTPTPDLPFRIDAFEVLEYESPVSRTPVRLRDPRGIVLAAVNPQADGFPEFYASETEVTWTQYGRDDEVGFATDLKWETARNWCRTRGFALPSDGEWTSMTADSSGRLRNLLGGVWEWLDDETDTYKSRRPLRDARGAAHTFDAKYADPSLGFRVILRRTSR